MGITFQNIKVLLNTANVTNGSGLEYAKGL